ncbi:Epimerase family protein [Phycisphaerales bacterium]|nr:Epimerase family protein [Phycisphaerales bacterium]
MPVPARELFAWHERPGAFERLAPPWMTVDVLNRSGGIREDGRLMFLVRRGLLRSMWDLRHVEYVPGERFTDRMEQGPFRAWTHVHEVRAGGEAESVLRDSVDFAAPAGIAGRLASRRFLPRELERLFAFRHARLRADLSRHAEFDRARGSREPLRIAMSGSRGFIGSALHGFLASGGHHLVRLVRQKPGAGEVLWQPGGERGGQIDREGLEGVDTLIHLAGESPMRGRWTAAKRLAVRDSRVEGTRLIANAVANLAMRPRVLIVASGIGVYGDRGEEELSEEASIGSGFFAELTRDWEAAAEPARQAGVRVVHLRMGAVLSARGGALKAVRTPFSLGLGVIPGLGTQWWAWVAMEDVIGVVLHAIAKEDVRGSINLVTPGAVRAGEFCRTLAKVLDRPLLGRAPAWAVRPLGGERTDAALFSTRAVPERLRLTGYRFAQPALEGALRWELGMVRAEDAGMKFEWA